VQPTIRIMVSRHSAFYSPVIATIAAGFLEREGFAASYSVLGPGQRTHVLLQENQVDVVQSAVSSNWKPMESGASPLPVHFALINRRDGFFLVARLPADEPFEWSHLAGRALLADHGLQPLAMLRFAVHCNHADWSQIQVADAGTPEEMEAAFRAGTGDYVHLQSPAAHRLEHDGAGRVVASVGRSMPAVAFSSLCASRAFLGSDAHRALVRAYAAARQWARETPADEVASTESEFFPGIAPPTLATAISAYQDLGCWDGGIEITRELYSQALNVFQHAGQIQTRHPYHEVCAALQD
jgi:NitT/TauT family transport system substrate-binding protein